MGRLILSGYTRNINKGIHILKSNSNIFEFDEVEFIKEESPTYIVMDREKDQIISISARKEGGISLYSKVENKYVLTDEFLEMGSSPCHLYFDEKRRFLYSSNYHKSRLDIFYIGEKNIQHLECRRFSGSSIISPDQDISRIHMAINDRDDENLIVCDLGSDKVYIMKISDDGKVESMNFFYTEPGFGPRHITYGSVDNIYYLIGELSSEIYVLNYDIDNLKFSLIQKISSLPDDIFVEKNTASAIKVSKDGRFLYSSNRGADIITVFEVGEDGRLRYSSYVESGGKTPRDFGFYNNEEYVVVGHQNEEYCTILSRNQEDGSLNDTGRRLDYSEIVCVENID